MSIYFSIPKLLKKLILYIILGFTLGFVFLKDVPIHTLFHLLIVLFSCILAIVISCLLIIMIGLFSFIIEDSTPFYWLYSKAILILGTLFPIEFFPSVMQPILTSSPVYAVASGPAKLFVDFSWNGCVEVLFIQLFYVGICYILCKLVYQKGVKKLNVNGG